MHISRVIPAWDRDGHDETDQKDDDQKDSDNIIEMMILFYFF